MIEVWKKLDINNKYFVSNMGRLKNKDKIINGWIQNTGYITVNINNKKYSLHRLIAKSFIKNDNNYPVVNHIDGNKINNCVNNLEWCTIKQNIQHAFKTGLMDNAIKIMMSKKIRAKKIGQFALTGSLLNIFNGSVDAQNSLRQLGIKVNARNIRNVCEEKRKKAGGFMWKYLE